MKLRWRRAAWIGAVGMAAATSHAVECQMACVSKGGKPVCKLSSSSGAITTVDHYYRTYSSCEFLTPLTADASAAATLILRYRHKSRWFTPPEGVGPAPLQTVFAKYPADTCSVPSPNCIQARMNGMVAAIGGHGIDNKDSKPGGEGNPCQIALPCGVVLPPPEPWSFRLADAGISGTWTIRLARGTPPPGQSAETSVYIKQGVARLPGTWFAPGAQYTYRFVDDAGRVSSTGEFSVASRATRDTLQTLAQRRVAEGLPDHIAWADTLAANNHDWDAYQLTLAAQEPSR
jgi:hypothetical protein